MAVNDPNDVGTGGAAAARGGVPQGAGGTGAFGSGTVPSLFAVGLGSFATPMFIQNFLAPKTTMVSTYGNFLDISSKEQKLL
jgi:hypothetical protein